MRRKSKGKYVVVSHRSSHTVTASSREEARKIFLKRFPYAKIRFIAKVRDAWPS